MLNLPNVTLYGSDTINVNRLLKSFAICEQYATFGVKKIFTHTQENYTTYSGTQVLNTALINSLKDYNQFNLKYLNDHIETDFVMVAEHDGFILNPEAWSDEFLNYDYIGAPWLMDGKLVVGNGGFSIRSKRLLELVQKDDFIQLGNKSDHRYAENEDWVIGVVKREYLENKGIRFAPVELAKKFSFESQGRPNHKWQGQFGFHGLRWTDISEWTEKNPQWVIDNPAGARTSATQH